MPDPNVPMKAEQILGLLPHRYPFLLIDRVLECTDDKVVALKNVTFNEPPAGVTEIEAGAILVFDVPFPHPGPYRFVITIDGETQASVPVTVSQVPQAPQAPGGGGQALH